MTSTAHFSCNGDNFANRGFVATNGQTVNLQLSDLPALDVNSVTYSQIAKSKGAPDILATPTTYANPTPPTTVLALTMPASGWYSWIIQAQINGGNDANGNPQPTFTFTREIVIRAPGGSRAICPGETFDFDPTWGWTSALVDAVTEVEQSATTITGAVALTFTAGAATITVAQGTCRTIASGSLTQDSTLTYGTSGAALNNQIETVRQDTSAWRVTHVNGGPGGGSFVQGSGNGFVVAQFDGTNWWFRELVGGSSANNPNAICARDASGNCSFTNLSVAGGYYLTGGSYGASLPSITTGASSGGAPVTAQAGNGTGAQTGGNIAIIAGNGGDSSHTGGGVTLDVGAVASSTGASAKLSVQQNTAEWLSFSLASSASTVSQFGQGTPKVNAEVDTVQTTNATVTTISTYAMPDNTLVDFSVTIAARNNANNGDAYRADLFFTYQRFGGAAPSLVGAAPSAQNVRTNGSGSSYAISVTTSSNNVIVQVTGVAATTINWSSALQAQVR